MSDAPLQPHPALQALCDEIALLREELADSLTREHDLLHVLKPNLLALFQQKLGAWELQRLHAQTAAARARRRLELAQSAANHGKAPDWTAIDGQLEIEFLTWRQRIQEAAAKIEAARDYFQHTLPPAEAGELKKLYYALVKKLHPDLHPQLTDEQRRLWQRVQDAYTRADLTELRALAVLAEKAPAAVATPGALEALRRDRDALQSQIAGLERRLEQLEAQPPFTLRESLADEAWIAARRAELEAETAAHDAQRTAFEAALAAFLHPPDDGKKFGPN